MLGSFGLATSGFASAGLRGRRLVTTAFCFPILVVVLFVRHHAENEHFVTRVEHSRHESILIPANVEHHAASRGAGRGKRRLDFGPVGPCHMTIAHMRVPSRKRSGRVLAAGALPKLA
jgi:hypothetical protein